MTQHEDETHALITAVESLCFALRAKQAALANMMEHNHRMEMEAITKEFMVKHPTVEKSDG